VKRGETIMKFDSPVKEKLKRINKYGIIGVLAIVLFAVIEIRILVYNANTCNVVFAFDGTLSEDSQDILQNAMEEAILRAAPDTKVKVKVDWIFFDPVTDTDSFNKLMTLLGQNNYYLFIMSDQPRKITGSEGESLFPGFSSMICSKGWFDPLSEYGVVPDAQFDSRVKISKSALFQQLGVGDTDFYASIIDWSEEGLSNKNVSYAASIIDYILKSEE
jgi:hypothetical protein